MRNLPILLSMNTNQQIQAELSRLATEGIERRVRALVTDVLKRLDQDPLVGLLAAERLLAELERRLR